MHFDHPTYVILPIQPPIADLVHAIRRGYGYPPAIPVEVTVAGSSGGGVIKPGQDPKIVLEKLREIAAGTPAFTTAFGEVRRFPNTSIFWFSLQNEAPFRALHQRLMESGIEFDANPFPYQPHCTLQVRRRSEEEAAELLQLQVPGEIRFDEIALASLIEPDNGELECPLIWRSPLTAR